MANTSIENRQRIHEFLPTHDFCAAYEIRIDAPTLVVYQRLLVSDFNEVWIVRVLMTLRSGRRIPRSRVPTDLRKRLRGTGFLILAEVPNEELVIGVAGRFWRPDGGRCLDLTADDFAGFSRPGYAKVAWNFKLRADSTESSILSTEKGSSASVRWRCGSFAYIGVCRPVLWAHATGDSEASEDRGGITG
jgi:hypothetical protein